MKKYNCRDNGGEEIEIEANTMTEAAQEYVDGGDWGDIDETKWIDVMVVELDADGQEIEISEEKITVTLQPEEPECDGEGDHDWESPHEVLGGCRENPGVHGHGGGVVITEVCAHCGAYRVTDTWASRRDTGEQGLRSVAYRVSDETSQAWIAREN